MKELAQFGKVHLHGALPNKRLYRIQTGSAYNFDAGDLSIAYDIPPVGIPFWPAFRLQAVADAEVVSIELNLLKWHIGFQWKS